MGSPSGIKVLQSSLMCYEQCEYEGGQAWGHKFPESRDQATWADVELPCLWTSQYGMNAAVLHCTANLCNRSNHWWHKTVLAQDSQQHCISMQWSTQIMETWKLCYAQGNIWVVRISPCMWGLDGIAMLMLLWTNIPYTEERRLLTTSLLHDLRSFQRSSLCAVVSSLSLSWSLLHMSVSSALSPHLLSTTMNLRALTCSSTS